MCSVCESVSMCVFPLVFVVLGSKSYLMCRVPGIAQRKKSSHENIGSESYDHLFNTNAFPPAASCIVVLLAASFHLILLLTGMSTTSSR